jgi:hypothetical protein
MFDSLSNIIIVLIPLAVLIGRIVLRAQAKRKPEPPKKQPPIPVHFEDYDDEDRRVFSPSAVKKPEIQNKEKNEAYDRPIPMDSAANPLKMAKTHAAEPAQSALSVFNLNRLSPMKQAVVMAEILGPPKGMQ